MIARCTGSFGRRPWTTSSAMFITASAAGRNSSRTSTLTPFAAGSGAVVSIGTSSRSNAPTGAKPSFAAAIESTPDPQPTSTRLVGSTSWRSSRQSRVVGCAPVPNARPGSTTTGIVPPGASSHGGPTQRRPTTMPWWKSFHASSHPSRTSSASITSKPIGGSSAYTANAPSSSSTPSGNRCSSRTSSGSSPTIT